VTENRTQEAPKRRRAVKVGVVTSDKMQKTVTVRVDRTVRHDRYKRFVKRSTKFMAHDETGQCKVGDTVEIVESRPLAAHKRWRVRRVVRPASGSRVEPVTVAKAAD
jgi:small subunit ribosomal protein S17